MIQEYFTCLQYIFICFNPIDKNDDSIFKMALQKVYFQIFLCLLASFEICEYY